MNKKPNIVAFIPARSGSKRIVNKNIKLLAGKPLIAYTIETALQSEVFDDVIVCTDSEEYQEIARQYGATVPFLRDKEISSSYSPDIEWVKFTLGRLEKKYDCFSIIRPTSPFRTKEMIQRAWNEFLNDKDVDSLRAVEKCSQHPAKMWTIENNRMTPVLKGVSGGQPLHSNQYSVLPEIYAQNASLEIAWTKVVTEYGNISGEKIMPFYTTGYEGFDINNEIDWKIAEEISKKDSF